MNKTKKCSIYLVFFLIITSILILFASSAQTSYQLQTDNNSESINSYYGYSSPASSVISYSSSTQTQSYGPSVQSTGVNNLIGGIITESRMSLANGQHSQHLIRFIESGQVQVKVQDGASFNVYSKKGDVWPNSNSYKTDYDKKMEVTSQKPALMNTTPGTWIFTIEAPQEGGEYFLSAIQNGEADNQQSVTQSTEFSIESVSLREQFPLPNHTPGDWNFTSV